MATGSQTKGQKRSKAFYRKSAYGSIKKQCTGSNILEPGICGFLVLCNHDERSAVRESYNILNDYADELYGPDKNAGLHHQLEDASNAGDTEGDEDCDDVEMALKKEVAELKRAASSPQRRFQNVATKAKNCVFIRTALADPVVVGLHIMKDIAKKRLKRARYAARIIPVVGTCRATTKDIEKLAVDVLSPIFSKQSGSVLTTTSFTVLFKMRNNNGTSCGRESVIPLVISAVKEINSEVTFSWTNYSIAILVEVVCTVCCIGVAPDYIRLRKYNLQELTQGPKCPVSISPSVLTCEGDTDTKSIEADTENESKTAGSKGEEGVNEADLPKCVDSGNDKGEGVGCDSNDDKNSSKIVEIHNKNFESGQQEDTSER